MIEIVIQGLNMKAVNALIWTSAILGKLGIVTLIVYGLLFLGAILTSD